eukprot:scaffold23831_cov180-Amphora_coffeaeformis.AAC.4
MSGMAKFALLANLRFDHRRLQVCCVKQNRCRCEPAKMPAGYCRNRAEHTPSTATGTYNTMDIMLKIWKSII